SVPPSESASVPPSESLPAGSEGPIVGSASPSIPGGGELPIDSGSPGGNDGGVAGLTGQPAGATPPPTDTSAALTRAGNDGWRVILLGIAAIIAAAVFLVPSPATARVANRSSRRGR
nr:hypothetical protein [Chloroflexota bacterium]